ncbi:MAG: hypothetical protein ACI94Y_003560 [Maribacter sp.]|jgi:hypothetical protein
MILLSEYSLGMKKSAGVTYLNKMEDTAKLLGIDVINFEQGDIESLKRNLFYQQNLNKDKKVFWLGFVPEYDQYQLVYEVLKKDKLELINTPEQFSKSEYFDQFYPFIKDDSIESGIASNLVEAKTIANKLKYPIFLKGTIQSLKNLVGIIVLLKMKVS